MALKIFNTLSGKKEPFKPLKNKRVNLFVCGPTVYDLSHLGHARTYAAFDVIVRYLRHAGYEVFYLQNITDIDDKIIVRAKELNADPLKFSRQMTKEYYKDAAALKIKSVTKYAKASEFIPQIIRQIQVLLKKGYAYEASDGVYFDISKFPDYGKLSGQKIKKLKAGARVKIRETKKHPFDFDLWKKKKPGEPAWASPWGAGRPGWHIEDTAISENFFGPQYDLHGGAYELIFPHHESEIAQMEATSGKKPFVKYWLHTGVLKIGGEKMSKSLGNFITVRDFLEKYPVEILRFIIVSSHYRSVIDYNKQLAVQAKHALDRISEFLERLDKVNQKLKIKNQKYKLKIKKFREKFFDYMDDDFNTPRALSVMFDVIKTSNASIDKNQLDKDAAREIKNFFGEADAIFGILPPRKKIKLPKKIAALVEQREKARQEKNWALADQLRAETERLGYKIEDTPKGPTVKFDF